VSVCACAYVCVKVRLHGGVRVWMGVSLNVCVRACVCRIGMCLRVRQSNQPTKARHGLLNQADSRWVLPVTEHYKDCT
jgi:hypothetical protein